MDTRTSIIERLTYGAANDIAQHAAYPPEYTFADLERANRAGWTVETSATDPGERARGTVIRHEGVRLSAADLERVWRRAVALVASGEVR